MRHGCFVEQVERVQEVARQCISTLVSLHKHDVIHCDLVRHAPTRSLALVIGLFTCLVDRPLTTASRSPVQKPENILIESLATCKIRVIDYGNAYLHEDQRCSYVQSRAYRAPEVVLGLAYDTKVDMWSLGCILMELFTGKLLFDNTSVQVRHTSHATTALMVPYCSVAKHRGTVRCADIAGFPHRASWALPPPHAAGRPTRSLLP